MKAVINWFVNNLLIPIIVFIAGSAIFLLILNYLKRLKEFKKNFEIYKPVTELEPSDFGIPNYYLFYLRRESDEGIEKYFKEKNIAFITGLPNIGKTRGAYELAKKYEGWFLLKPHYERIDVQNLKFPPLFSRKRIILFLDDLEKYAGKFNMDVLIYKLRQKSEKLKIIATCRSGKEFDQASVEKEMTDLLSHCQSHKIEPRKLNEEEERALAEKVGKKLEEVTSDGTPGSIVLGLKQMKERYKQIQNESKTILKVLKLLREAYIFRWTEELVGNIAKSKIFELKGQRYEWDKWLSDLELNGFIKKSKNQIRISHDSYLDDSFIADFPVSNELLVELKNELFNLKDAENLLQLGNSFYYRKNLEEGIDCYKKSVQIDPYFALPHYNLGILLYDLKRYPEAEKEYREAIRINPEYVIAHNNLGLLLHDLKRYHEAEEEYGKSIKINPNYTMTHYNLGLLLYDLKRYPEAEKEYKEAIRINPENIEAHAALGILLSALKKYTEAEKKYREIIRICPEYVLAHNNLGVLLHDLKRFPEAEKEYREAIKINPDDAEAHNNLGFLLHDLKRYHEAEKEYREAIKIKPDSADAHYNLGNLLDDLKKYPEAEKEYREAIRINPNYAKAYGNLGLLFMEMGKKEEAKKELQKARDLFKEQGKEEDVKKAEETLKKLEEM